jgi:hypothetical protein
MTKLKWNMLGVVLHLFPFNCNFSRCCKKKKFAFLAILSFDFFLFGLLPPYTCDNDNKLLPTNVSWIEHFGFVTITSTSNEAYAKSSIKVFDVVTNSWLMIIEDLGIFT